MSYKIKLFKEINEELKESWARVEKNSLNNCFSSFSWIANYVLSYKELRKNSKLRIFIIYFKSEPVCILPFEIVKKFKTNILYWACDSKSDFHAPLRKKNFNFERKAFKEIWNKILCSMPDIDIIYLKKQLNFSDNPNNPFISFLKNSKESTIHQINLPKKWKDYTDKILKNKFYKDLLRTKKLLKKFGKVEFIIAKKTKEKFDLIEQLIEQKKNSLEKKNIRSISNQDLNFYKNFEKYEGKEYFTQVSALKLNGRFIAIHWGVITKNRYYYLLPSMIEGEVKKFSPGKLLLSLLIRRAISKKIEIFDFGLGDETYKKKWSNKSENIYNHIELKKIKGLFFYILIQAKQFINRYKKY